MRGRRKEKKSKGSEEGLFDEPEQSEPRRITPVEIQQKEFRLAMRGYHERDVDEFLDEVTEEVARLYAENKRLREEIESKGGARLGAPNAQPEADAIIRQARDEAARILAEAEAAEARARAMSSAIGAGATAAGSGSALTGAALASFLSREKSFLQNLAKMMQEHANAMKEDVRRVRDTATRSTTGGPRDQGEPSSGSGGGRTVSPPVAPRRPEPQPAHDPWRPPPPEASGSSSPAPTAASRAARGDEPQPDDEQAGQPPYFMDEPPRPSDAGTGAGDASEAVRLGESSGGQAESLVIVADPRPDAEPYLDEPTREWTLGEGGVVADDAHELTTGRGAERGSDTATAAAPAIKWVPQPDEEASGDERSLKELFWGED